MPVPLITEPGLPKALRRQQPSPVDARDLAQLDQLLLHWRDDADRTR